MARLFFKRDLLFFAVVFLALLPVISYAQTQGVPAFGQGGTSQNQYSAVAGMDALTMLTNLEKNYPALWQLVTGACYFIGFILALRAVAYLKVYGELRTMTATQSSLKVPVTYMVVSAVFLFMPTAFSTMTRTVFSNSGSIIGYQEANTSINPVILTAIGGFVQFIGLISFVRGWMMLVANAQSPGGGNASFGKAMTHIVGGFFLINIYGFWSIMVNTFGVKFTV